MNSVRAYATCVAAGLVACVLLFVAGSASRAHAEDFQSPDILVLGDSQLSFGSGPVLLDFFKRIATHCKAGSASKKTLKRIEGMRTTLIGARSSYLRSWLDRKGRAHGKLCKKDPTWGVNASIWGHNTTPSVYVQIGEGEKYAFCEKGWSPLQVALAQGYYEPKLVMFYMLGNGARRWSSSPENARRDVEELKRQLPMTMPCIYMSTAPSHTAWRNKIRRKAQDNLKAAFDETGNRCAVISALTPAAIAAIEGKNRYFRRRKNGTVKDPFHPDKHATRKFLALNKQALCRAVTDAFEMKVMAVAE